MVGVLLAAAEALTNKRDAEPPHASVSRPVSAETVHHAGHDQMGYGHGDTTADSESAPTDFIEVHHGWNTADHLDNVYHTGEDQRRLSFLP